MIQAKNALGFRDATQVSSIHRGGVGAAGRLAGEAQRPDRVGQATKARRVHAGREQKEPRLQGLAPQCERRLATGSGRAGKARCSIGRTCSTVWILPSRKTTRTRLLLDHPVRARDRPLSVLEELAVSFLPDSPAAFGIDPLGAFDSRHSARRRVCEITL